MLSGGVLRLLPGARRREALQVTGPRAGRRPGEG